MSDLNQEDIKEIRKLADDIKNYCVKIDVNQRTAEMVYEMDVCARKIIKIIDQVDRNF